MLYKHIPILQRFLDNFRNVDRINVYNDGQNVHNSNVQQCLTDSIHKLIANKPKLSFEETINEIVNNNVLTNQSKCALVEYSKCLDVHLIIQITFSELLVFVWERICNSEFRDEILAVLNTELSDSICKCFTGRISRLVNCLNGFDNDVQINISKNEQISNIVVVTKNKLNPYDLQKHKEVFTKEMLERGYDEKDIEEWLMYIE